MLRGAIFDLGETLIHLTASLDQIREARIRAVYDMVREKGATLDFGDLRQEYTRQHEEESDLCARTLEEMVVEESLPRLLDRLRVEPRKRPPISDLVKAFFALEIDSWVLFPGVHEMLSEVRALGLKTAILSNARSDWAVKEIANRLGIAGNFDRIVTSAAVGLRKPRPEPFEVALRELGLSAREVVMIGNSIEADIAGARSLGLKTIHVIFGDDTPEKGLDPDATVHAVSEIVPAIRLLATSA